MAPNTKSEEDYFYCQDSSSNEKFCDKKIEFADCKKPHITNAFLRNNLPKSPMPKQMSSASYNNLNDIGFESEEECDDDSDNNDDSECDDETDYYDDESNADSLIMLEGDQNVLRTESTISLVKINPLLFNIGDCSHKAPISENFKIGSKRKDTVDDIKHLHLPRTPFPKALANNNCGLEIVEIKDNKEEMNLDLQKSSMLNRRRTSVVNQPNCKTQSIIRDEL